MATIARLDRSSMVRDVALAAVAVVSLLAITPQIEPSTTGRSLDTLGYSTVVGAGAFLAGRRRWPAETVVCVTVALTVYLWRGYPGGPVYVTLLVALYSVARWVDRRVALVVAGASSGWLVVIGLIAQTGPGLVHLVFVGWSAAVVFLGDGVRSHRAHLAGLEERAAALVRSREEEVRRRVTEERLRIARDLHDTVAHSMSAINVQAGAAAHLVDPADDRTLAALEAMKATSRVALEQMQGMLGLLRVDGCDAEAPGDSPRGPTPDLRQLADLVTSTCQLGVAIDLEVEGQLADVPLARSVAAYRIIQESLTNVIRHAGAGAAARVTVSASDGALALEVTDDGRGSAPPHLGSGAGIIGMRERAHASGGTIEIGPRVGGGFRVQAWWTDTR